MSTGLGEESQGAVRGTSAREVELCFGRVRSYLAGSQEARKAWGVEDMFEALDNLDLPEGPERRRRRALLSRLEKLATSPEGRGDPPVNGLANSAAPLGTALTASTGHVPTHSEWSRRRSDV